MKNFISLFGFLLAVFTVHAELFVTSQTPKTIGDKTVVTLGLKNTFDQPIKSARAVIFLLDDQGKMVGQSTKWVIGGSPHQPALATGATNTFNFVITANKPLTTTNLTTKLLFNRLILENGQQADVTKDVQIQETIK